MRSRALQSGEIPSRAQPNPNHGYEPGNDCQDIQPAGDQVQNFVSVQDLNFQV